MGKRKRCVIVGTGIRATVYTAALVNWNKEDSELVGLCDVCQSRMDWHNRQIVNEHGGKAVPTYHAGDFDRMLEETKPDVVIVTTPDYMHHEYACRALEAGRQVHCEKPMTTDLEQTRKVLETVNRTGGTMVCSLNLRYSNLYKKVKDLVSSGVIGEPKFIVLAEMLDSAHGADYFRRWHRDKAKSGGFLIQKSSHHFDLVNWWLGCHPKTVFAMGDLLFYGREAARTRGIEQSYERYTGVSEAEKDPFALHLDKQGGLNKELYYDSEKDSDYVRDRNVFGEGITIEDTIGVVTRYKNGVIFNYTLVAYATYDGLQATITGTKGRIELHEKFGPHIVDWVDGIPHSRRAETHELSLQVHPMFEKPYEVEIPKGGDGHGGGDQGIAKAVFSAHPPAELLADLPSHIDGAAASLLGIAANRSMETGLPVDCDEMLPLEDYA